MLTASSLQAESRFPGVRLVVGRHGQSVLRNPGLEEVEGVLTVDTVTGRLRFEASGRSTVDVALETVIALHYEESSYPRRPFRRHGLYLTVHHTGAGVEGEVAIFRLPRDSADDCLAVLARDTGHTIDRRPSTTSWAGLPIHLGIGDVVYVTRRDGRTAKGTMTQLGLTGIALEGSGQLDEASIREIEVSDPIWGGVVIGAGLFVVPAAFASWSDCRQSCSRVGFLTPGGWGIVATGAFIGGLIDKKVMRHAYRGADEGSTHSVQWTPLLARGRAGVELTLRF